MTQNFHEAKSKSTRISETKAGISTRTSIDVEQFVRVLAEIAKRVASTENSTKQEDTE